MALLSPRAAIESDDIGAHPAIPVVDLAGVTYRFTSGTGLVDLDLAVPAGSITVMVGPNGAGKTTALRIVTGALVPHAGTAKVFGLALGRPMVKRSGGGAGWWQPSPPSTTV